MRIQLFLAIPLLSIQFCSTGFSQRPSSIPLWTNGAPGSTLRMSEKEVEDVGPGKCNVTNIHNPSITALSVTKKTTVGANESSAAILICPGGGHRMLCLGHEGVPAELHIYSNAGHGLGYRTASKDAAGDWPIRLREWLVDSSIVPKN